MERRGPPEDAHVYAPLAKATGHRPSGRAYGMLQVDCYVMASSPSGPTFSLHSVGLHPA